jgi:transcriptional regulator with XRE-family HTH domain
MPAGQKQSFPEKLAFAQALTKLRGDRHLTQEALASESGYHPKYISLLEQGRYSPSLTTILELSEALQISASDLVSRVERLLPKNRRRRRETREIR